MSAVVDEMDTVVDRLEDIAEGWCMAADDAVTTEIKQAIAAASIEKQEDGDAPDWRETLASLPD
jgi:hypothetical protein